MSVRALIVLAPLVLGGCALPLPVQIASWAADGVSFLATGKSMTDHGISAVAQQDCAMWRAATTGEICIDEADDGVALAELEDESPAVTDPAGMGTEAEAWAIADAAAAEAESTALASAEDAGEADEILAEDAAAFVTAASFDATADAPDVEAETEIAAEMTAVAAPPIEFYYVIASFARRANAEIVSRRHAGMGTGIVEAQVDGRLRHRVVVGPVQASDRTETKRRLTDAGLKGVWPLRLRGAQVAAAGTRTANL